MSISNGQRGGDTSNRSYIDYTNKDYNSLRDALLAPCQGKISGLDGSLGQRSGRHAAGAVCLHGRLNPLLPGPDCQREFPGYRSGTEQCYQPAAPDRYELRPAQPASVDLILLFKPDIETDAHIVTIDDKAEFKTTTGPGGGDPVSFRYVRQPLTIDLRQLPLIQHTDGKTYRCYKSLPVVQVDSVIEKRNCWIL